MVYPLAMAPHRVPFPVVAGDQCGLPTENTDRNRAGTKRAIENLVVQPGAWEEFPSHASDAHVAQLSTSACSDK
jgi:hypothetical protein